MGTRDKENGRSLFARAFKQFKSPAKASPSQTPARAASQDARGASSRLPAAPPQSARGSTAAPAGSGSHPQLRNLASTPGHPAASSPRNFARAPQSARGPAPQPAPAVRRPAPDGSQTARRVPKPGAAPNPSAVSPGCSYKEALTTPRLPGASKLPGPPLSIAGPVQHAPVTSALPPAAAASQQQQVEPQQHPQPQQQMLHSHKQQLEQDLTERQQQSLLLMQQQARSSHEHEHMQQQSLLLMQQQARSSHEHEHMQQQISRLEASMAAQQAKLQERLAALALLGERREALAEHLASLNQVHAQAEAAEAARRTEVSELELAIKAVQAAAETHRLQAAAGENKAAAARASLLGIMQAVAQTLRLPALAAGIQQHLSSGSSSGGIEDRASQPASSAAAALQQAEPVQSAAQAQRQQAQQPKQQQQQARRPACPKSPSEAGSQCYATPPGSVAGGEESTSDAEEDYQDGSSRGDASDCGSERATSPQPTCSSGGAGEITARCDSLTGGAVGETVQRHGTSLPLLHLSGMGQLVAADDAPGSARGPSAPASRIPGVLLVSPVPTAAVKPAAAGGAAGGAAHSGRMSPQLLLRLQSINSKLEAALADQALLDFDAV